MIPILALATRDDEDLSRPWIADGYLWATNRVLAARWTSRHPHRWHPGDPPPGDISARFAALVDDGAPSIEMPHADLVRTVGPRPVPLVCVRCGGYGTRLGPHLAACRPCDGCDGTGHADARELVALAGVDVRRARACDALRLLRELPDQPPDPHSVIGLSATGPTPGPLCLQWTGVTVLVMGVTP